jgi:hypothetical protein
MPDFSANKSAEPAISAHRRMRSVNNPLRFFSSESISETAMGLLFLMTTP